MRDIAVALGKIFIRPTQKSLPAHPKKILIIRSGGLGDVIMSTPLVKAIRSKYKKAKITYLVGSWAAAGLYHNPYIDRVWEFDDRIVFKKSIPEVRRLIADIKKEHFDMCFILDKSYLWNLIFYFAKIPCRIGFDRHGEGFANTLNVAFDGSKYELDYYRELASLIKVNASSDMELFSTAKDRKVAIDFLKNIKAKTIIGIAAGGARNPGQTFYAKRWPIDKYIGLINVLTKYKQVAIILLGGRNDGMLNKRIIEQCISKKQVINAATLSVHESFEVMKRCKLIITHDSGPMHMAGASGAALIALFGPTPAHRFAPRHATVIYSPAAGCPSYDEYGRFHKKFAASCMETIDVDTVYTAAKEKLRL